jgi:hypothetical protein
VGELRHGREPLLQGRQIFAGLLADPLVAAVEALLARAVARA